MALVVKNPPANAGETREEGSVPGPGRPPRGGNGNPLQYSCLENVMDRGAWWATVHSFAKSQTHWTDLARTHAALLNLFNPSASSPEVTTGCEIYGAPPSISRRQQQGIKLALGSLWAWVPVWWCRLHARKAGVIVVLKMDPGPFRWEQEKSAHLLHTYCLSQCGRSTEGAEWGWASLGAPGVMWPAWLPFAFEMALMDVIRFKQFIWKKKNTRIWPFGRDLSHIVSGK